MQEALVRLGTWIPFERVPGEFHGFMRSRVSAETVRRLTEAAGAALVDEAAAAVAQLERDLPEPPAGPAVQQLSADGAMVPLVHGEWTEVKTLALGTVARQAADAAAAPEIHATDVSYFARCTDAADFGRLATCETHRRGTPTAGTVVAVTDGAAWLQDFIDLQRPDAVRILDFPHAVEHLTVAAQAVFGPDSPAAVAWLDQQCHELKHGDPDRVLDALAALPAPVADAAHPRETTHAYLAKRRDQIAYAQFQAIGYPIGDGMVESANKVVVEQRLKGSGMHWARENINPMLVLRTTVCNDRWDEAWPVSCRQRRQHVHDRRRERPIRRPPPPPAPALAPAPPAIAPPRPPRDPLVVNGKPTAQHPWRHFYLPGSRDVAHDAKR